MTLMFNIPSGLYFGLFQIPGDNITVSTFGSLCTGVITLGRSVQVSAPGG